MPKSRIRGYPHYRQPRCAPEFFPRLSSGDRYSEFTLLIRGRQLEAFCLAEQPNGAGIGQARSRQVRRLRRDSQSRSGWARVTVRANYVGLPSMAGRGTDEGGESRRIMGEEALSSPRKYGPEAQNRRQWSAGRRGILSWDAHAGAQRPVQYTRAICVA